MKWLIYTIRALLVVFVVVAVSGSNVSASAYNYNHWLEPVPAKDGYKVHPNGIIYGKDINLTVLQDANPVLATQIIDLFVTESNYFVVDKGSGRVGILDKSFNTVHVFKHFEEITEDGVESRSLIDPRGIFVTSDSEYYITDYENQAIFVFDENYAFIKKITTPDNPTYGTRPFQANKIVLDRAKRIYVTIGNVYDGIVELTNDGAFSRFFGVQEVSVNAIDILWRRLMTDTQLERTVLFLPVEYTSLAIDNEGFIYATATSQSNSPIQRLNSKGIDVLRRNGYVRPIGDVLKYANQPASAFVSIAVNDYGMYSVVDFANKKIFTYNDEGYLIYVTGGDGDFEGMFKSPTSVVYDGENLLISDSVLNTITIFTPTTFGAKVNEAIKLGYMGEYLDVAAIWHEVIEENANFSYAYIGIGNQYFREKNYKAAMDAFRLAHDKTGYSKAYDQHRKTVLRDNFPIIGVLAFGVIGITIIRPVVMDIRKGAKQ